MIHEVILTQFKQHEYLRVNFTQGINILKGENAQGKTNLLRGILFGLFGANAAGSLENLTTWGSSVPMRVDLDITLPEAGRVKIFRTKKHAEVRSHDGEKLHASGLGPVTRFVEDSLQMPYRLFKSMQYAEQGDAQLLLKMGASGLQQQLETISKVGVIDKILTLIGKDISGSEGMLSMLNDIPDIAKLEEDINILRSGVAHSEVIISDLSSKIKSMVSEFNTVEENLKVLKHNEKERRREAQGVQFYQEQMDEQTALEAKLDTEEPPKLTVDLQGLKDKYRETSDQLADAKAVRERIATLSKAVQQVKQQVVEQSTKAQLVRGLLIPAHEKFLDLKEAKLIHEKKVSELRQDLSSAICGTCMRPFDKQHADRSRKQLTDEERNLEAASADLQEAETALESLYREHSLSWKDISAVPAILQNLTERLTFMEKDLASQETPQPTEQLELMLKNLDSCVTSATELGNKRFAWEHQKGQCRNAITGFNKAIETCRSKLLELPEQDESAVPESEHLLETLRSEIDKLKVLGQEASWKKKQDSEQLQRKQAEIDKAKRDEIRKAELQKQASNLKQLSKYLRDNRSTCMTDYWQNLTGYASALINTVTESSLSNLVRDSSGAFAITKNDREIPVDELSGAEKSIVGLCLRIALTRVFYGPHGFLLLDEVTADCTETNAARVSGLLQSLNTQTIMITHRQGDTVNAGNIVQL